MPLISIESVINSRKDVKRTPFLLSRLYIMPPTQQTIYSRRVAEALKLVIITENHRDAMDQTPFLTLTISPMFLSFVRLQRSR